MNQQRSGYEQGRWNYEGFFGMFEPEIFQNFSEFFKIFQNFSEFFFSEFFRIFFSEFFKRNFQNFLEFLRISQKNFSEFVERVL